MDKNFGLSTEDFDRLVGDLKKNETVFFKQIFLSHFKECMVFLQKQNRATYDDAYDATMDTIIQFRRLLVAGKLHHGNLKYLFTKMASQIYIKNQKAFLSQELKESDLETTDEQVVTDKEDLALLNLIWEELGPACKELLKLHYYGKMRLTDIAGHLNKTPAAARKQKERCLEKVRSIFKKRQTTI